MLNYAGYFLILLPLLGSLFFVGYALVCNLLGKKENINLIELAQSLILVSLALSSGILFYALLTGDFSLTYVADYTDSMLPWYYKITAFWAGQDGSFLFWTFFIAFMGWIWSRLSTYNTLEAENKTYFWIFFLSVQAFFLLILCTISNPFALVYPPLEDGSGLNPLLQHPGMIFHPPVLFLGYAGFTVPSCLALAVGMSAKNQDWLPRIRNWVIFSWIMLTAGIILGAWWSYMELGWGGYWAWDPVENASLLPWLFASAFIHTSLLNRRTKALPRTNIFLSAVTLLMCFFATFITRSGLIDSLHAFGQGGLGTPFIVLMLLFLLLAALIAAVAKFENSNSLSEPVSKQGMVVVLTWLLAVIGLVIIMGSLWPVLSKIWSQQSVGLDKGFYNRVCLPLFALIFVLLLYCPWLAWIKTKRIAMKIGSLSVLVLVLAFFLWWGGNNHLLSLIASAFAIAICVSMPAYFLINKISLRNKRLLGVYSVHFGLALIALGVAFSGPFKQMQESVLSVGESMKVAGYTITYKDSSRISHKNMDIQRAKLQVEQDSTELGYLFPERRFYKKFDRPFAEASVMPGLVDEIYATVLGLGRSGELRLQIRVNPMVNWLWIGGTLVCIMALFTFDFRPRRT